MQTDGFDFSIIKISPDMKRQLEPQKLYAGPFTLGSSDVGNIFHFDISTWKATHVSDSKQICLTQVSM